MKGVNKAIIIGHLGQDPDVRYTPAGKAIVNISVATSEKWKDRDGNPQESTDWHRIVFFNKIAEVAAEYLKKGSLVYIEGKNRTRKWKDKEGVDRYTHEIVVDGFGGVMQMLGGKAEGNQRPAQNQSQFRDQTDQTDKKDAGTGWDDDDDIPFR